jgi:shikimate kinase
MNIILIGYRGTGKSVVGRILAHRLNRIYEGMDANIVKRAGKSIPDIVASSGWAAFRDLETIEALELARRDDRVIDTGGGIIERPENMPALNRSGWTVWLRASVKTIMGRICGDDQRPALVEGKTFTEEVAEVLARREPGYAAAARHAVDTDGLTPDQVAETIIAMLDDDLSG